MTVGEFKKFIEDNKLTDDRELIIKAETKTFYAVDVKPVEEVKAEPLNETATS